MNNVRRAGSSSAGLDNQAAFSVARHLPELSARRQARNIEPRE
jgi:hypothetical protein